MATTRWRVSITGVRPLLWHRFGPEAIPLDRKARTGVAGNDPEEWRQTVLATKDHQLYLEPSYIFGCLREGGKHTSIKRGTLQSRIACTLQVIDERVLLDRWLPKTDLKALIQAEDKPVYLDVRSVRNPATKGRNVRYRVAASSGWTTSFDIAWDDTIVSDGQMRAVMIDAGKFVGLGDGRSIGFGRFTISSVNPISENAKKPAAKRTVAKAPR